MAPSQLAHDVISIVKEIADLDWMVATWNESTMGVTSNGIQRHRHR